MLSESRVVPNYLGVKRMSRARLASAISTTAFNLFCSRVQMCKTLLFLSIVYIYDYSLEMIRDVPV
jgi:hypothetical protein